MYGLLQPIFPKWFELVLLKHAQTISHGSPPFVGGTLCGKKNALFSTQSSRKSVTFGTVPFFLFLVIKNPLKKILVYFPTSFVLSSYCYFAFLEKMKGSEWDGGETLQIEIFVLQHFFRPKKMEKKNMSKYHSNIFKMIH